jgi:hypothetical protein
MKALALLALSALVLTGCKTANPAVTRTIVTATVSTVVAIGTIKNADAVPYLRAAAPVICAAAANTNLQPAEVVYALQASSANEFKTPIGVIVLNNALALYVTLFNEYGADWASNAPVLQSYLAGTCDGIMLGLPAPAARPRGVQKPLSPHVE